MTARKINCSTKYPLDCTRRATLRGLLEDSRTVRIRLRDRVERVQYRKRKDLKGADTEILRTDRIPRKKVLLRIQEPKYRTGRITSLVYVV
jgi:hypothetical protein